MIKSIISYWKKLLPSVSRNTTQKWNFRIKWNLNNIEFWHIAIMISIRKPGQLVENFIISLMELTRQ